MSIECQHGYLARACDQCEADAEIARLTRELEEARTLRVDALAELSAMHTRVEQRLYDERDTARRERDEARQALEAERARVAELKELVREHGPHGPLCASEYSAGVWADAETLPAVQHLRLPCDCWKSRALAAEGGEG